jgi:hypothetical protein
MEGWMEVSVIGCGVVGVKGAGGASLAARLKVSVYFLLMLEEVRAGLLMGTSAIGGRTLSMLSVVLGGWVVVALGSWEEASTWDSGTFISSVLSLSETSLGVTSMTLFLRDRPSSNEDPWSGTSIAFGFGCSDVDRPESFRSSVLEIS